MKVAHKTFFSRLSYSFGNEDWRVERKALKIKPTDRVVCITASGDRPLNLLMDPCAELISIDLNETQNYLLSLKINAMKHFSFEEYLPFLGAENCTKRLQNLSRLLPKLDAPSRQFWHQNQKLISKGVLYQGAVETLCRKGAFWIKLLRGKKLKRLFEFDDLEKQREFINNEWNSFFWRKSLNLFFHPKLMRPLLSDPGLYAHIGKSINSAKYITDRLHDSLQRWLAKDNAFISLIFRGYVEKANFPVYLTDEGYTTIKNRLDKLSWKTANFITYLENSPPASFDCFSVSDIASYMPSVDYTRLLRAIYHAAKPGARFSIRQFMSDHTFPEDLIHHYQRDHDLEHELEKEEQCFVYRFITGTINK